MEISTIIIIGTLFTLFTIIVLLVFVYLYQRKKRELALIEENRQLIQKSESYRASMLAVEAERSLISKELHDQLGSDLLSIIYLLEISKSDQKLQQHEELVERLQGIMTSMQHLSKNLYPQTLDKYGLKHSLEEIILRTRQLQVGFEIEFVWEEIPESSLVNIVIYRCVQELLNNAMKHSKANIVTITVSYRPKLIQLDYMDDGIGFNVDAHSNGSGLLNIHNRVSAIGGEVLMASSDEGSNITIEIPHDE
jgi:signal transduction histidine kinase